MRKIDSWLDIQKYVAEAQHVPMRRIRSDVEIIGRPAARRRRRFASRLTSIKKSFV
jgi:hypothetical protein